MMFEVGEVVVCVEGGPCRCVNCAAGNTYLAMPLRQGSFYRIEGLGINQIGGWPFLILEGVPAPPGHVRGASTRRFRKLPKAGAEFTEMLRARKPKVSTLQTDRVEV